MPYADEYILRLRDWTLAGYQQAAAELGIGFRLVRNHLPDEMHDVAAWSGGQYDRAARSIALAHGLAGDGAVIMLQNGNISHVPCPDLPDPICDVLPMDSYIFADVMCDTGPAPWIVVAPDNRIIAVPSEPEDEQMLIDFVLGYGFRAGTTT